MMNSSHSSTYTHGESRPLPSQAIIKPCALEQQLTRVQGAYTGEADISELPHKGELSRIDLYEAHTAECLAPHLIAQLKDSARGLYRDIGISVDKNE
jgi:hypothetical protein